MKTHSSRVFDKLGRDEERKRCNSARNSAFSPDCLCTSTVRANNRSSERMIFLSAAKISQKDDDADPASCGMLSAQYERSMKFMKI